MPMPKPGESKDDYMGRCVPMVMDEGRPQDEAIAMCSTMFNDAKKDVAPQLRRAYSVLEIKSADAETGLIEGLATSPNPDRLGDVVEPKGAVFKLPIPLLWQHRSDQPVGEVVYAKVTDAGINVRAKLSKAADATSETLRARLAEAWDSVRMKLVRGFSIGFNPLESAQIKDTFSFRYLSWEWLELSLVTIPANMDATIQVVRSLDLARNRGAVVRLDQSMIIKSRRKPGVIYFDKG